MLGFHGEAENPLWELSRGSFRNPFNRSRSPKGEAAQKSEAAEAVRNIVSLRLEQAHKTVEANKAFHAAAWQTNECHKLLFSKTGLI